MSQLETTVCFGEGGIGEDRQPCKSNPEIRLATEREKIPLFLSG
jgi:hypothetical protein